MPQTTFDRPRKRAKLDQSVSQALSALRARLSLKSGEVVVPQDDRLILVGGWLDSSPGAQDLFNASTQDIVISLLSSILSLLSSHFPYHVHGVPIIKALLSPQWLRRLNSYLSETHSELILSTLKLFHALSIFGSGRERKAAFEAFPWDNKTLPKLLHMRRKGKGDEADDMLVRPDIRTYYILFILSFVDQNTPSTVKVAFLEHRRDIFMSVFRGLIQDCYSDIQKVLQVCWESLWCDPKIKRTIKVGVLNEVTISHLLKLYDRAIPEKQGGEHVPADVVHHFLLAICTRPGQGICFRDRGWYPRETDDGNVIDEEDAEVTRQKGRFTGRVYKRISANVLRTLNVNEDARQQELALKIMTSCPELVSGYWAGAALTLEPRLSFKWVANISFTGQVLSQAVPTSSFLIPGSAELYNPTPPPLSSIMANVFPPVGTKAHLSKGLQAGSAGLVQHCTALVLVKCLRKLAEVVRLFKMVEAALEEEEDEGQWNRRRKEVEKEARRRVPEFQVIIAFSQQNLSAGSSPNGTKNALLSESSQRLLWLYQECLPDVVAEARFEVGKLVLNLAEGSLAPLSGENPAVSDGGMDHDQRPSPLQSVKQLHVLRLLSGSDQFTWAGKVASSSHTYLHVLLKTFCITRVRALRTTLRELLQHVLAESVLFQEDPSEIELWLAALPSGSVRRGQGTETPDGAPLTDEVDGLVAFLDDWAQCCLKTPYRYMEAMMDLLQSHASSFSNASTYQYREAFASPLLMAVLEQAGAKMSGRLMSPSDTLAVFTFLTSKQGGAGYGGLHAILDKLEDAGSGGEFVADYPSVTFGIRRELSIMNACLGHLEDRPHHHRSEGNGDNAVAAFLDRIEQIPVPTSESGRIAGAFELIDWLRLADVHPSSSDITRIVSVVRRFHEPALWTLIEYLHPSDGHLWNSSLSDLLVEASSIEGGFDWLFFQCNDVRLEDERLRGILLNTLYSHTVTYVKLERAICLITRGISVSRGRPSLMAALLSLLSAILEGASSRLSKEDLRRLKDKLQKLIEASFSSTDAEDKIVVSPISSHWAEGTKAWLEFGYFEGLKYARPWVKFMDAEELFSAINVIEANPEPRSSSVGAILEDILTAIQRTITDPHRPTKSKLSVSRLLGLQALLPGSDLLEEMISTALTSELPYGISGLTMLSSGQSLSTVVPSFRSVGASHHASLSPDLISRFLEKDIWTESTAKVIVTLIYVNTSSSHMYTSWLNSEKWNDISIDHVASTLAAFLDCVALKGGDLSQIDDGVLHSLFEQLLPQGPCTGHSRIVRLECICRILQLGGVRQSRLSSTLQERIQEIPVVDLAFEMTYIARRVLGLTGSEDLASSLVDRALQWAVRHFSSEDADWEDSEDALVNLENLAKRHPKLEAHLVEPLLTIVIQNRLADANIVELAVILVNNTALKPVVVNRLLQNFLQHPFFFRLCGPDGKPSQKDSATCLLDALFRLHPTNTCQPSHAEPLLRIYGGTMSTSDRRLLSIMRLFEAEKHASVSAFFARWSPSPDASVTNVLGVVQNFDPIRMLRTCLAFPNWRRFGEEKGTKQGPVDGSMYDLLIVIVLSSQMLVECLPTSALGWVKVFWTNIVSLLIRCLSSKDSNIWEVALYQIGRYSECIQVLYVFRLLKNVMHPPANAREPPRRLPTYASLILLHALRGIFYPSNFIYPRTARFLLQRPELDVSDVPMLFGMLYSSSDEWKGERGWIVRLLGDGMASAEDWKVLRRRHTWDLVATLFQSSGRDKNLRAGMLEILANLMSNSHACTSLVLKSSLLIWIEMNIVFLADVSKLERATGGEWCVIICRCLSSLLQTSGDKDTSILNQSALVILRLSLVPGISHHSLGLVLEHAVEYLKQLEPCINLRNCLAPRRDSRPLSSPPHHPLRMWGEIVEGLWRVSMTLEDRTRAWDVLMQRLLIWRSIVGDEKCPIGEWVRRETVRILCASG
ncbi:hypothetical protein HYDPIDRAFT_119198 [Hydnomerulius pinastri MD-312]|uniref:Nucleolar pre-ribosomal-associated protein 1 C-terminal domain-containing protein n=1 Tax=Hydnomerulius pinastri MD-312 TaxID=994086 RepID=A0A0C9W7F8_9AGAM|nr:hypothetical protein HYDPIDRAFT_119198 [Hydnomerulius pinastri MD-312]